PFLVSLIFFGFTSGQNTDWHKKVSPALLANTSNGQSAPFILLLSQQADVSDALLLNSKDEKANFVFHVLRQFAAETQGDLIGILKDMNAPYESLFIINGIWTEGTLDFIQKLAQREDVARIISNQTIRMAEPVEMPGISENRDATITWGIDTINANDVWELGFLGQNVVVGGEDTGYDWRHPALINQYRGYDAARDTADHNYNWHDAIHEISPL